MNNSENTHQVWHPVAKLAPLAEAALVPALDRSSFRAFREDVRKQGVLVPLEVTGEGIVLDGCERLRAAIELGLERVPVRRVAPADPLEYRVHCALQRRHLTASQRAALVVALDRFSELQEEGKARRGQNLRQYTDPAVLPDRGETRAIAAKWASVSPRTIGDAITAAQDEELFAQVQAGKLAVDVAARRVRRRLRAESAAPPPPLPEGPFDLIYIDPPWQMGHPDSPHAPEAHYETLSKAEIIARVPPAAENAFMAMWAVNSLLPVAFEVIDAWGFTYKSDIIWDKLAIKLGRWARNRHETLLFATRGNFHAPDPEDLPPSVIQAPCGRHSEKPEVFYEWLERMYPHASKLEMYARNTRPGWTSWGNEAEGPR